MNGQPVLPRRDVRARWRPVRWLNLVHRKGWQLQRGGLLVSPRGTKYLLRRGWARRWTDWLN